MQLTECKANHFKSEMDRLRERQMKIEHEKLELQKKIRDADYFVHQLTVEKDKREAEADKLKKELICAKLAEREATARLLNFLNRSRKNSDETAPSIIVTTTTTTTMTTITTATTNSQSYSNINGGGIHHHPAAAVLAAVPHNPGIGSGLHLVTSVSTPSLTNSNSTADIHDHNVNNNLNRHQHHPPPHHHHHIHNNQHDVNVVVGVIGNQEEEEEDEELIERQPRLSVPVEEGNEDDNEEDDFETKEFVLTESEMEQITKEIERSRQEYLSRKKLVQRQLQTLRSEIELLKIEENQTNLDILSEAQLKAGETKYSTLKKLKSGSTKARVAFFEEL